ncbi:LolA family protein [Marixanthomonas ophiurae]|uniref:Outer membrane lipoprotein carrier protein LolA n=1 Tax=Marixanthomonas ophiurae TaxID=387659 RepID=A0A3E1QBQ6_9FLAO|nr:outer membrane lipoprotein carrier protein LolA [Marixanthomonas ophiurae]RFN59579.1 outer membrane lipoprotein carrier protein LolA [Marixanthomonas ophiurae]
MKPTFIILFSLLVQQAFAQTPLTSTEIKDFKQHVEQTAQQTETIVSDFVQEKQLEFLNEAALSKGTLTFKAPDAIRWEYTKPYTYEVIFKGNQLTVHEAGSTKNIDLSSNKLFESFNSLLINSIKGDMFKDEDFTISYYKTEKGFMVSFIPKEKRMKRFIASFQLSFSEKDYQVTQLKLIEPSEDFTLITFKNKQINVPVPDSIFKM